MKKLLIDQFVMTPPFYVVFFVGKFDFIALLHNFMFILIRQLTITLFTVMSFLERKKDLLEECKQKFIPTFKTSCVFWLPAQAVNFMLVPPAARVIYVGMCSFVWINMLCWIKRNDYSAIKEE